jgi:kynurenine formamidase
LVTEHDVVGAGHPHDEVAPGDAKVGNLHRRILPGLGLVVGELFNFEALSVRCAELIRWEFLFTSVPTNITGGVGSPANALAIL